MPPLPSSHNESSLAADAIDITVEAVRIRRHAGDAVIGGG